MTSVIAAAGCNKVAFADESSALRRLVELALLGRGPNRPIRAYRCPSCHSWHLTRKP